MNALEIRGLNKNYGKFQIKDMDLTLPGGCIMGLIGRNGAGKTTTINLILNMLKRESGTIKILGKDNIADAKTLREDIGIVNDETGISGCLTAEKLEKIMKLSFKSWDSQLYRKYLIKFSLPPREEFKKFSRGMKMKLGIAIALSHKPKLLILDEATSGLDPVVRDEILDIFMDFTRDENHSILISSHIISDLEKICDYIAFIKDGEVAVCEEKDTLKEEYALIHCSETDINDIAPEYIKGKKTSQYGVEAIVAREAVPEGCEFRRIDIEELFVFMSREGM